MKFCITGANGFIGVHLIHHILRAGHEVRAIIRPQASLEEYEIVKNYYQLPAHLYKNLEWKENDYSNPLTLEELLEGQEYILHFAGSISYSKKHRPHLIDVNVGITKNVVNAAINTKPLKLIYCSSIAAITKSKSLITEENEWNSEEEHSFYGYTKHLGELEVRRGAAEGLNVAIINPGIVLGFGLWTKGSNSLFKNAISNFPFYSKGITGFIGVNDVASMTIKLCLSDIINERIIFVSENKSFHEISLCMSKNLGTKEPKFQVTGFLYYLILSLVKLKDFFGIAGLISTETTKAAVALNKFDNSKLLSLLNAELKSMDEVIKDAVNAYKKSPPK